METNQIFTLGKNAEKSLDSLLEELRKVKKLGYLHIFQYGVASHPLKGSQERFVRYLLAQAQVALNEFFDEVKRQNTWRAHYSNPSFTLKSIEILLNQLNAIDLDGDLTAVVTIVENIGNNLHLYVTEFEKLD